MRKIILFMLICCPFRAYSQIIFESPVDTSSGKIIFTNIVEVPNTKQKALHNRAKEWFIKTYNSGKDVIQLDDPENGKIIGRAFTSFNRLTQSLTTEPAKLWYMITIVSKDNKFKYTIDDITIETEGHRYSALKIINSLPSEYRDKMTYSIEMTVLSRLPMSIKKALMTTEEF